DELGSPDGSQQLLDDLEDLEADELVAVGVDPEGAVAEGVLDGVETTRVAGSDGAAPAGSDDPMELGLAVVEHLGASEVVAIGEGDVAARVALAERRGAVPVPVPDDDRHLAALVGGLAEVEAVEV